MLARYRDMWCVCVASLAVIAAAMLAGVPVLSAWPWWLLMAMVASGVSYWLMAVADQGRTAEIARLRLAVASMQLGIWDWDIPSNRLNWDAGMFAIYGNDPQGFTHAYTEWASRVLPEDLPRAEKALQDCLAGIAPYDLVFRIRDAQGHLRHVRGTALVQRNAHGVPVHMIGLNRDISDLVEAERALVAAKEQADAATRAKAEFLAVMSHEIRTPLNGILGFAGMLQDTSLDPRQQEMLTTLRTCGDGLLVLINDILDVSKFEAGRFDLEEEDFDTHQPIDDAIALVAGQVRHKGLELTVLMEGLVPTRVRGDQNRLRQVLTNLLSNAVKFTDRGRVSVGLAVLPSWPDDPDGSVRLGGEVQDTGIGIGPEAMSRLFTPFAQADRSISRRFGGTGLGLTISRHLVQCMHGEITVESRPDQGTCFRFSVRLSTVASPALAQEASTVLAGRRVLVALASTVQRGALAAQCRAWGCLAEEITPGALAAAMGPGRPALYALAIDHGCPQPPVRNGTRVMVIGGRGDGQALSLIPPWRIADLQAALFAPLAPVVMPAEPVGRVPNTVHGHVLVAEDNPVNQRVIRAMLTKLGLTCDVVENGREAVIAVAKRAYDLVLMDCQMPEVDGLSATREIRANEAIKGGGRSLPVIALSAGVTREERADAQAAGMDAFLGKPVEMSTLTEVLTRWLPAGPAPACEAEAEPLADVPVLRRLREDAGDLHEYLQLFTDEANRAVSRMLQADGADRFQVIATTAHRIKGTAFLISARRFAVAVQQLESAARLGEVETVEAGLSRLPGLLAITLTALCQAAVGVRTQGPPAD